MGRRWLKLLPKHEYFSESPNRTSKPTIACKLNAQFELNYPFLQMSRLNYPFLRMSRLLGPPVTVAPPKQEKKFLEKIYAFDSNDYNNKITIKDK